MKVGNHQPDPLLLQLPVAESGLPQVFGASDIEPDNMASMVDHAHLVGLRVVDSDAGDGFGEGLMHKRRGTGNEERNERMTE
jgi:hypothetical protein